MPIVCINVNDYYKPFEDILHRAYEDELIKLHPEEIIHFAANAEEAVRWIEAEKAGHNANVKTSYRRKVSVLKQSSFMSPASGFSVFGRSVTEKSSTSFRGIDELPIWSKLGMTFVVGALCGFAATRFNSR